MLHKFEQMDPRIMHFMAFFSRILLLAFIPAYIVRKTGENLESLGLWSLLVGIGAIFFVLSSLLYYKGGGAKSLLRWDALFVASLFGLPLLLPFDPGAVALLATTAALICLAAMNFLFVHRWPPKPKKGV